jgi:D-serine deaminase-like pyridoxal phosphate-dependent protein
VSIYARSTPVPPVATTAVDQRALGAALAHDATTPIAPSEKGFAALAGDAPVTPSELAARALTLAELGLTTPYAVLDAGALAANLAAMARYCAEHGVVIAPHAKTSMSPQVWAAHLEAGAWGMTAASAHQAALLASTGVRRILVANEIADPVSVGLLRRLLDEHAGGLELCCYVDSPAGAAALGAALEGRPPGAPPLSVLVELGFTGGRGGARSVEEALGAARAVHDEPSLRLAGAAAFEGTLARGPVEEALPAVRRFVAELARLGEQLLRAGLHEADQLVLSAGGSCCFDVVTEELTGRFPPGEGVLVVLRAGGYACHDDGLLARWSPFVRNTAAGTARPALHVRASVVARPEPRLVLLDAGRRDCSTDADLPVVTSAWRNGEALHTGRLPVVACNDQHAFVELGAGVDLAPGDLVELGISHCCTTFDKWRAIPVTGDGDRVLGVARTYF